MPQGGFWNEGNVSFCGSLAIVFPMGHCGS